MEKPDNVELKASTSKLSIHTPDLDDVFLALTGRPDATRPQEAIAR